MRTNIKHARRQWLIEINQLRRRGHANGCAVKIKFGKSRAVGLFRDSLTRNGFLGIGAKESLRFSRHAPAFADFVREEKIYQRREP